MCNEIEKCEYDDVRQWRVAPRIYIGKSNLPKEILCIFYLKIVSNFHFHQASRSINTGP